MNKVNISQQDTRVRKPLLLIAIIILFLGLCWICTPMQIKGTPRDDFKAFVIDPIPDSVENIEVRGNDIIIHPDRTYCFRFNILPKDMNTIITVNQLKLARYFFRQAEWLVGRFPKGRLCDVEGLVKLVDKVQLKENDWSLTPGRYVGVAPEEEDPDFSFGETMRTIHTELEDLAVQSAYLAKKISQIFKKLKL